MVKCVQTAILVNIGEKTKKYILKMKREWREGVNEDSITEHQSEFVWFRSIAVVIAVVVVVTSLRSF